MQCTFPSRMALAVGIAVLLCACSASKNVTQTQQRIQAVEDYRATDMSAVSKKLNTYRKEKEDKVLYHLERGMLHHYQENWERSSKHFTESERAIEKFYTESINRNLQSMLVNDLQLAYEGEAYEDIYINAFKCLNYLHQGNREAAMVETRRATHKLEHLSDRYKGLAESVTRDTAQAAIEKVDEKLQEVDLLETEEGTAPVEIRQHSALGRFIATVLHTKNNAPDDARIEFEKLQAALQDQEQPGFLASFPKYAPRTATSRVVTPTRSQLTEPGAYNTLIVALHGYAPRKRERKFQFDLQIEGEEIQLTFAVPVLRLPDTNVARVRAHVAGEVLEVPVVEDMQETAKTMFAEKKPIVYTRAVLRSFLKAGATELAGEQASKQGGAALEWLVEQGGEAVSNRVAQADTRNWQTMPGLARATVAKLPAGRHTLIFEFLSPNGRVLETRSRRVEVSGRQDLALAEAIFLK
mgnify:CR=1 FL=1